MGKRKETIKNLIFNIEGVVVLKSKMNFSKFDRKFFLPLGASEKIVNLCFKESVTNKNFDIRDYFKRNSSILTYKQYKEITRESYNKERINKTLVKWLLRKRKEYKIFLLTNNTIELKRILKNKFGITDIFNKVFNSAEIGLAKPDPRFFRYILKKIKSFPKECLFVDNNTENIKVARKLDFKVIFRKKD